MNKFYGYISKENKTSLFGYELSLREQGCKPVMLGEDDKKYYAIYLADKSLKNLEEIKKY